MIARGPFSKAGAVPTSAEAAESLPELGPLQLEVLRLLRGRPSTSDEAAERLRRSILSCRPRFSELHDAGLIADTGARRVNSSGRNACVWAVTGSGIEVLEAHEPMLTPADVAEERHFAQLGFHL